MKIEINIFTVLKKDLKNVSERSWQFNNLKGIFQPFELGGVTRLIRSTVKFWKAGN